jgi:hypothetical protein
MQCENLYDLHRTANLIVVVLVFKIDKILSVQISTLRKRSFLAQDEVVFPYFIFLQLFFVKHSLCNNKLISSERVYEDLNQF